MARTANQAGDHVRSALLAEEALTYYLSIGSRFNAMLALDDQGAAFAALNAEQAAQATWWQARALAHAIGNRITGPRLDARFAQMAEELGEAAWAQLAADLAGNAENWRQQALADLRRQAGGQAQS